MTTTPAVRGTVLAEAAAAVALQLWLARRLARATEHATVVEDVELHVPRQRTA